MAEYPREIQDLVQRLAKLVDSRVPVGCDVCAPGEPGAEGLPPLLLDCGECGPQLVEPRGWDGMGETWVVYVAPVLSISETMVAQVVEEDGVARPRVFPPGPTHHAYHLDLLGVMGLFDGPPEKVVYHDGGVLANGRIGGLRVSVSFSSEPDGEAPAPTHTLDPKSGRAVPRPECGWCAAYGAESEETCPECGAPWSKEDDDGADD